QLGGALAAGLPERRRQSQVAGQAAQSLRQRGWVVRLYEDPALAVAHGVDDARHAARDRRQAVRARLDERDPEAFAHRPAGRRTRRQAEDVGLRELLLEALVVDGAGEGDEVADA